MRIMLVAVFSGIFFLAGAVCSAAEMEIKRAPAVKSVRPKYPVYRPYARSKRKAVAPAAKPAPVAAIVPVARNNDWISEDVTRSWQPYSYP